MYAIVESGGRQYRTEVGSTIETEKLSYQIGDSVNLDQVLLVADGENTTIGMPRIEGAVVKATVINQFRGKKIRILKYKAGNRYRIRQGHRQNYTRLRIEEIIASSGSIESNGEEN